MTHDAGEPIEVAGPDEVACDECGSVVPNEAGPSIVNHHHEESCSLYEAPTELEDLARECAYSDEGGFDAEGNDRGSVDALIEYKNALEERFTAARNELLDMHKMLYPERYERTDHIFWLEQAPTAEEVADGEEVGEFQWSSETIEWIAEALQRALADHPDARLKP